MSVGIDATKPRKYDQTLVRSLLPSSEISGPNGFLCLYSILGFLSVDECQALIRKTVYNLTDDDYCGRQAVGPHEGDVFGLKVVIDYCGKKIVVEIFIKYCIYTENGVDILNISSFHRPKWNLETVKGVKFKGRGVNNACC